MKFESITFIFKKIKSTWIDLISSIKSLFTSKATKNKNTDCSSENSDFYSVFKNGQGELGHNNGCNIEGEIWYDALESQALDDEIWYDAQEEQESGTSSDEQELEELQKETQSDIEINRGQEKDAYEKDKYYSLQNGLQEKSSIDDSTTTLALVFEAFIREIKPSIGGFIDFNSLRLFAINKVSEGYELLLKDEQSGVIKFQSSYLNMYNPSYFKDKNKASCTELFSLQEGRTHNTIVIPLQVPKDVTIFTKEFWRLDPKRAIQSQIPEVAYDIHLQESKKYVDFSFDKKNNIILLDLVSAFTKTVAKIACIPCQTRWPVKDILVRGDIANCMQPFVSILSKQYESEQVNHSLTEVDVNGIENASMTIY
ncbi:hypothetical protein [Wolbachia endosymbiont of Pentidionis agamae]|uniref:hypothetical protein n=1 Tax=Wolbachia endosymbiont of Pentidionis agamae TaxID=3110435 RepID=UPI002FCF5D97